MNDFREVINDCKVRDLGFQGIPYTWSNRREGSACICERLDMALVNAKWCLQNSMPIVVQGSIPYYGYTPLWVDTAGLYSGWMSQKPFRFESMWVAEEGCTRIIADAWKNRG